MIQTNICIRILCVFLIGGLCCINTSFASDNATVKLCTTPPVEGAWDLSDNETISIPVSFDVWTTATTAYRVERVGVDIDHTYAADLWASIISPWNNTIRLWQLGDGTVMPTDAASRCDKGWYAFELSDDASVILTNRTEDTFCIWENYDTLVSWQWWVASPYVFGSTDSSDPWIQWVAKPIDPLSTFVWDSVFWSWTLVVSDDYSKDFWRINEVCLNLAFGWVELYTYISEDPNCSDKKETGTFLVGTKVYVCSWIINKWTESFSLPEWWAKNDFWIDFSSLEKDYPPRWEQGSSEEIIVSFMVGEDTDYPVGTYILNSSALVKWTGDLFTPSDDLLAKKNALLQVISTALPVLEIIGDENVYVIQGQDFTDQWVLMTDPIDGSIVIYWEWEVDTSTPWTYMLTYNYTNSQWVAADEVVRFVTVWLPVTTSKGWSGWWWGYSTAYMWCSAPKHLECKTDINGTDVYFRKEGAQCVNGDLWKPCEQLELYSADFAKDFTQEEIENGEIKKTRDINQVWTEYFLEEEYASCKIIDTVLDENLDTLKTSKLKDIAHLNDKKHIERLEYVWIIDGTPEGNFEPLRDISRIEFLKIVLRTHCIEYRNEDTSDLDFSDTVKWTWQSKVIKKAYDLWIIHGDTSIEWQRNFRENDTISKIEATKILFRMSLVDLDYLQETEYKDITIGWHMKYVLQWEVFGVFNPTEDDFIFNADGWISRKDMVKFLYKTIRLYR